MSESNLIEIERVRSEAAQHLAEHKIACERRYGELQAQLTKIEALHNRNTRLLGVILVGMLTALGKAFWPVLGGWRRLTRLAGASRRVSFDTNPNRLDRQPPPLCASAAGTVLKLNPFGGSSC